MPVSYIHFMIGLILLAALWNKTENKKLLILAFLLGSVAIDIDHLFVASSCGIQDMFIDNNCASEYIGQFLFHHFSLWLPFGLVSAIFRWKFGIMLTLFALFHISIDWLLNGYGFWEYW